MDNHEFEQLLAKAFRYIDENIDAAAAISDDIADNPELSGKEFRTAGILRDALVKEGFTTEMPYCGMETAFCGKCGGGPVKVAFLAEYDALPEVGHGCGHNLSGMMSLLAGEALSKVIEQTGGEVLVIGTPAEETWGAKCGMADMGIADELSLAMMIHCYSGKSMVSMSTPALRGWNIKYSGVPAHAAAAPWEGRNAFNGSRLFFDALDMMRQHVKPDIRMHGIITESGTAVNTVPERASIHLELRALDKRDLESLTDRVRKIAAGAAEATETSVTFEPNDTYFYNSLELDSLEKITEEGFAKAGVPLAEKERQGGASDMGNISWRCPSIQPLLSITDIPVPLHTKEIEAATRSEMGHQRLAEGAKIMVFTALKILTDQSLREKVKAEFESKKQ